MGSWGSSVVLEPMRSDAHFGLASQGPTLHVSLRPLSQEHELSISQWEHGTDPPNPNSHEIDLVLNASGLGFIGEQSFQP